MSASRRLDFGDVDMGEDEDENFDVASVSGDESQEEEIILTERARYYYAERETIDSQVFNRDIFEGCGFNNIQFVNCVFNGAIFRRHFEEGQITGTRSIFHDCEFIDCQFNDCNFDNVSMYFVDFTNCDITNTIISSCRLLDTNFNSCTIISTVPGTPLTPNVTQFENCDMCRINFRGSQLENVSMRGNLSTVEFIVNDASGNPTGSITGSSEFSYAVVSNTLMAAIGSRGRQARLAFTFDIERIETTCESLERERDDFVQDVQEYLARDVESSRGEERVRVMEEQRRLAAEAVAATAPEEAPVFTGPTCFDIVMQDDEEIQAYLASDPNNFVIGLKAGGNIKYECYSLDTLKQMYKITPEPTDGRLIYRIYHECKDEAPVSWQGNTYGRDHVLPGGRRFVKITFDMITYMVVKPDWIFEGPIPEPRVFVLERLPEDVFKFVSSEFVPNVIEGVSALGSDHCNQTSRQGTYALVPVTLDANGNVPLTFTTTSSGGKRKGRKTRRMRNKNKKYTKKRGGKSKSIRKIHKSVKHRNLRRKSRKH